MLGDLLHDRYRIVNKLGHGGYSTIWLAHDEKKKEYVAVKVAIPDSGPRRESEILRELSSRLPPSSASPTTAYESDSILKIQDEFEVQGPNGIHPCYVMVPTQGDLKKASSNRIFPIQIARALSAKLTLVVSSIHARGIVHGGLVFFSPIPGIH